MARTGHGLGLAMARILARTMGAILALRANWVKGRSFASVCRPISNGLQKS